MAHPSALYSKIKDCNHVNILLWELIFIGHNFVVQFCCWDLCFELECPLIFNACVCAIKHRAHVALLFSPSMCLQFSITMLLILYIFCFYFLQIPLTIPIGRKLFDQKEQTNTIHCQQHRIEQTAIDGKNYFWSLYVVVDFVISFIVESWL